MVTPAKYVVAAIVVLLVAMSIALIATSLKKLTTEEAGLQYDVHLNKLKDTVYGAGLHPGPPGYKFIVFPRVYRTVSFPSIICLNKDGLTITLNVQFQYLASMKAEDLKSLIMDFKDHDTYLEVLKNAAQSVIHDTCSQFNVTQFQTSRMQFQTSIKTALNERLTRDFLTTVGDVQVSNIERPAAYEQVVREKETAKQNIIVAERERPRILTQAETEKREAETQAQITLFEAEVQARIAKTKARAEADAILSAYYSETSTYKAIMEKQNLTVAGLISYLTTRVIQASTNPVYINLEAPAKTNF